MIISVDTERDSPEAMKAAARLILELAGSSVPREPVPRPMRVQPERAAVPEPRMVAPAPESRPEMKQPVRSAHETPQPLVRGIEELGLEVYDDSEPTPRSVSVTLANRKDDERKNPEKQPDKPSRLPGGVQVY